MAAKKTARGPGNPPDSPWYSTPQADRVAKNVMVTMTEETQDEIARLAVAWGIDPKRGRSEVIRRLAAEAAAGLETAKKKK